MLHTFFFKEGAKRRHIFEIDNRMSIVYDHQQMSNLKLLDLKADYEQALDQIWEEQIQKHPETVEDELVSRGYAVENKLQIGGVLFLGMNPSYSRTDVNKEGRFFYDYNLDDTNRYFKAFSVFCNMVFEQVYPCHHDIFFIRHKDQKTVLQRRTSILYKEFFEKQLSLSREIIRRTDPRLIVVLNAGIRDIFHEIYSFDDVKDFDNSLGAYNLLIEGKKIPVIFSGMLFGQRALDRGSKMNLQWQIKHVMHMH